MLDITLQSPTLALVHLCSAVHLNPDLTACAPHVHRGLARRAAVPCRASAHVLHDQIKIERSYSQTTKLIYVTLPCFIFISSEIYCLWLRTCVRACMQGSSRSSASSNAMFWQAQCSKKYIFNTNGTASAYCHPNTPFGRCGLNVSATFKGRARTALGPAARIVQLTKLVQTRQFGQIDIAQDTTPDAPVFCADRMSNDEARGWTSDI